MFGKTYPKKDFTNVLANLQPCDILLFHNNKPNVLGDGIEWFSDGHVSHVAMYVGGGDQSMIHYAIGGCQKMKVADYCKDWTTIIVKRYPGLTVEQSEKVKDNAYKDLGKGRPYDYISYIGFMWMCLKHKLGDKNAFVKDNPLSGAGHVCSVGVDEWYENAGIDVFPNFGEGSVIPSAYEICPLINEVTRL